MVLAEIGVFGFIARPIIRPLKRCLYAVKRTLVRKKKRSIGLRRTAGINEEAGQEMDQTILQIEDNDPAAEAKRVSAIKSDKLSIKI